MFALWAAQHNNRVLPPHSSGTHSCTGRGPVSRAPVSRAPVSRSSGVSTVTSSPRSSAVVTSATAMHRSTRPVTSERLRPAAPGVATTFRRGGPDLLGQMLFSPMLDDRNDTVSARQMAGRGVWDRTANETGWTALLGDARGGPDVSPYAAPARATDLSNLPPTFIDAGTAETYRDEDVAYATRIWQAGGRAELHVWPGGFHGFDVLVPTAAISRDAKAARIRWLHRLLDA
jgi:hypothetical protein